MSISSELLTLNTTKQNIKTAINLKGVTVNDEPFADYPDKVLLIPYGGGTYEVNIIDYIEGSIDNIELPNNLTKIGNGAFYDCANLTEMVIPSGVTLIDKGAFYGCVNLEDITIPNTVTTIGNFAFYHCDSLTSIDLPSSITNIGNDAFGNCGNLTSVTLRATVPPTIGSTPFHDGNYPLIYVPAASVTSYQVSDRWQMYSAQIRAINE